MTSPLSAEGPASSTRSRSDSSSSFDEESLDPRVQIELEKLNLATDAINRLELELDDSRGSFRLLLNESTLKLNALARKLGGCIDKARPYYDARMKCKEAQTETQKAAIRFERANSMHVAAKEMVALAEQGLARQGRGGFDPAWQEMLNHSTIKVNEAEQERIASESNHKLASQLYQEAEQRVKYLQKDLKRNIAKSRPYFETKARFNQLMEEQKSRVTKLEEQVLQTKKLYAESLRNLEQISDEIHQQREEQRMIRSLGSRGSGVGAETPDPPHKVETPSPDRSKYPFKLHSPSEADSPKTATAGVKPEISLQPPESDEELELATVDLNDIRESLKEIKESLSACTTPERGASPIPQETVDEGEEGAVKAPAIVPSSPSSFRGLSSGTSEGNLLASAAAGVGVTTRSASFTFRSGGASLTRPSTAMSRASSADDLDSEAGSLASVEMLGDQQIEMLMIDDQIRSQEAVASRSDVSGEEFEGAGEGLTKRERELNQVLRSISLKHSVSMEKLQSIALNIKETSKKPIINSKNGNDFFDLGSP